MRWIGIVVALVAAAALSLAGPAAARPGHGPGHGPRCAVDHDPPTAETVAGHVANANAALDSLEAAVAAADNEAAIGALRRYRRESFLAICESKQVFGPPPTIDSLETLGDMHLAGLTTFDGAFESAGDPLKRPLRQAIIHEKRSCGLVIRVLVRLGASATPEEQARIDALVDEYQAACRAVEVPAGAGRPGRPGHGPRPGSASPPDDGGGA